MLQITLWFDKTMSVMNIVYNVRHLAYAPNDISLLKEMSICVNHRRELTHTVDNIVGMHRSFALPAEDN